MVNCFKRYLLPKLKPSRNGFQIVSPTTFHCQLIEALSPSESKCNLKILLNMKANAHPSDL